MNSLDPRVNRLPKVGQPFEVSTKAPLDQFGTFEVFVEPRESKPFQHEGIVHAPNIELAFVLAKEAFTRRFTCTSLCVTDTRHVFVSPLTENGQNAYDLIPPPTEKGGPGDPYEIFHLLKRGKQHIHAGTVSASGPVEAMGIARSRFGEKTVLNVWAVRTADIRFTRQDEKDLWATLKEKNFRDPSAYKGGERLKDFLERNKNQENQT